MTPKKQHIGKSLDLKSNDKSSFKKNVSRNVNKKTSIICKKTNSKILNIYFIDGLNPTKTKL